MIEKAPKSDIHLVHNLGQALEIAYELEAKAAAVDLEGVLGNYVGNEPRKSIIRDFVYGQGEVNMTLAYRAVHNSRDVAFGLATNNTNQPLDTHGGPGLVSIVADRLEVPFVHKGLQIGNTVLGSKPNGEQGSKLCEILEVSPIDTVLIDDQGVKNAGEAVRAGFKAIIVPEPIGLPRKRGNGVVEHTWVGRARRIEPSIYLSFEKQGRLAQFAFSRLAGVDVSDIGKLYDHRD